MFDPILLKTFVAVATARSFTGAAVHLRIGQSTVSQHVRRLEVSTGRRLLVRDTHSVMLTPDGEAMLGFARSILDANERARSYLQGARLSGRIRFGASEDFVTTRLADVLHKFTERHPSVELELTVALSSTLFDLLDDGALDLVIAKRRVGLNQQREGRTGVAVRTERLVWAARDASVVEQGKPLPLILFSRPGITRVAAIEALDRKGIPWRIVCTSGSLSGLQAAARAGLGVMVQPRSMVSSGLVVLPTGPQLPQLEEVEFILTSAASEPTGVAAALAKEILDRNARQEFELPFREAV